MPFVTQITRVIASLPEIANLVIRTCKLRIVFVILRLCAVAFAETDIRLKRLAGALKLDRSRSLTDGRILLTVD